MQCHDAKPAAVGLRQAAIHQRMGQAAAAKLGVDKDIQQIAAVFACQVQGVRGPIKHQQSRRSDRPPILLRNPAHVFAFGNHARNPWLKVPRHGIQGGRRSASHGGKHGSPMGGNQRRISNSGKACLLHDREYRQSEPLSSLPPGNRRIITRMSPPQPPSLRFDASLLPPGTRLAVGVSGGADSVALLRALSEASASLGLVLSVAHMHHGLRGAEADEDLAFVRDLAARLELPFHESRVNVAAEAKARSESIEEAARRLRYAWFGELMEDGSLDAVATAHTLDDQAETVCGKFLRGAWTEGLGGIHPIVALPAGRVIRPLLETTRAEVEAYLSALGQKWREDSSNRDTGFTRNRIRHELLPLLEAWNPNIREHLAQMARLAQDEESWWQAELKRLSPQFLLEGKPVRGGGRASGAGLALDVTRLSTLPTALERRLLRHAAATLGSKLDFRATEALRDLAIGGRAGQKLELAHGLRAERTPRELRLTIQAPTGQNENATPLIPEYIATAPCEILGEAFGVRLQVDVAVADSGGGQTSGSPGTLIRLRNWKAGDRVRLRYSSSPRKVKEVLERLRITGTNRALWPVLEWDGQIIWMRGVELEPQSGISVIASDLSEPGTASAPDSPDDDTFE